MLDISRLGPLLSFTGIFGGGMFWIFACNERMRELNRGIWWQFPEQSIWARDPTFAILAALPAIILFSLGLILAISPILRNYYMDTYSDISHLTPRKRVQLNLFYIGEIFVISTTTLGMGAFFEGITSTVMTVGIPTIIFAFISIICTVNLLSSTFYILEGDVDSAYVNWISRITILFLSIALVSLLSIVLVFQLHTLSFIMSATITLLLSGCLSILFLFPSTIPREK